MFCWKFQRLSGNEHFDDTFIRGLAVAFIDALGLNDWSLDELIADIRHRLADCQLLGVLEGADGGIYGSVMVSIPETPLDGKYLVWGDGGYLAKAAQRRIVWRQILENIKACYPEKEFGWIGCRTQNPSMMRSYGFFGKLYPFELSYAHNEGQRLLNYVREFVPQMARTAKVDMTSGICPELYKQGEHGRLGDYPVNLNSPIENQLDKWGFNRDNGDSLVILAKLTATSKKGILEVPTEDGRELLAVAS